MNDPPRAPSPDHAPLALVGRVLNERYRIEALIARGGMGSVYRAEDVMLGRACALKVVTSDDIDAEEGDFVQRFVREATMTARLHHPNCVSVLDFGEAEDGMLYLAMELLEGTTLADALRADGPFTIARFLHVARQACEGVAAAHALGVVHRDLKTANIFLVHLAGAEEHVKVLDFGIAKRLHDTALALTRPGQMLGTPTYMAPEQILAKPVDTRADIYSLGIVFYEMLVGRVPFDGTNFLDVLAGHAREPVPLMSAIRPDIAVPLELEETVRRMLAKESVDRFQDLESVLEALSRVDAAAPLSALLRASAPSDTDARRRASVPDESDRDMRTRVSRMPAPRKSEPSVEPPPAAPIETAARAGDGDGSDAFDREPPRATWRPPPAAPSVRHWKLGAVALVVLALVGAVSALRECQTDSVTTASR